MDTERFPILIKDLYRTIGELEAMFTTADGKKRHFTPDGQMVGSIGEILAAYHYGIELFPASHEKHDGKVAERHVQIKATQHYSINISHSADNIPPDNLLVLKIGKEGTAEEIYNGPGQPVWDLVKDKPKMKNGQNQISNKKLKDLMETVAPADKIKRIHP